MSMTNPYPQPPYVRSRLEGKDPPDYLSDSAACVLRFKNGMYFSRGRRTGINPATIPMLSSKIEHSAIFPSDDRQIQKEGRSSSVSYSTIGTTGHEDQYDRALLIIIFDHVLTHTYTSSRMKTTG